MSIYVWRVWEVQITGSTSYGFDYCLCGLYGRFWFPQETKHAQCANRTGDYIYYPDLGKEIRIVHDSDESPSPQCTCGIYGYNQNNLPLDYETLAYNQVLGVAEIWGKTIVAEYGYRAQYARMRALVVNAPRPKEHWVSLSLVAQKYKVPLLPTVEYARQEYFS
jgi:hypothetical protein